MKLKTQIRVDKYIGQPLAYLSNFLIRIVGQVLQLDHSLDRQFNTIAVAKYKGLGSIVQCTPLLQTLRRNYPHAHIIFVTTRGNRSLLEKLNVVDEILTLRDNNLIATLTSLAGLLLTLWKRRPGVFLDLEIYSSVSSLITSFSLARNRMGYYLRSGNYRMGMYTHMMYYNIHSPVSEVYLQFARLLGCREIITSLYSLKGSGKAMTNLQTPYFVINVNASDLRIERRWTPGGFIVLIDQLCREYPQHHFILIGNAQERIYVNHIYEKLNDCSRVVDLAGNTTFDELLGIIEGSQLMITNDTGPMHLGFALDTRIVALFGPCSPAQYGGHKKVTVIYKNVYCSPCVHEFITPPCRGDNQCMKLIGITEVMEAVKNTLQEGDGNQDSSFSSDVIYRAEEGGKQSVLGIVVR